MKLYNLLNSVSDILTPKTHSLFDYMIHTFDDDGGFLRTRYCYWEKPIPDFTIRDLQKILVCFKQPFREGDPYYEIEKFDNAPEHEQKNTFVKMQLFYADGDIEDDIRWSRELRYKEAYVLDLEAGTYEIRH